MATFNLVRNSRVFFTTNLTATNTVPTTGFLATNSQEITVLDGFTFSQASNADVVNVAEAGSTPVRGQRSFNTSLANVEFSFSTYVRPKFVTTVVKADESVLWNALLSSTATTDAGVSCPTVTTSSCTAAGVLTLNGTAMSFAGMVVGGTYTLKGVIGTSASELNAPVKFTSVTGTVSSATVAVFTFLTVPSATAQTAAGTVTNFNTGPAKFMSQAWNEHVSAAGDLVVGSNAYSSLTSAMSNKNQLLPFGMVFTVDGVTYTVDNCAMEQASIDFGLDGIATIAWTGKGTRLNQLATNATYDSSTNPVLGGGLTGTITGKTTTANFITNKLATVSLVSEIAGVAGTTYTLALTGGNITIANGINYVIPANLGIVNTAIGYYTGTRAVTGSINAYLRTGTTFTAGLLNNMLTNASTSIEPKFQLGISIGGGTATTRVEALINGASLQIPTVDAQAVMSTTINFTAQGYTYNATTSAYEYDLETTNDVRLRYFSV